MHLMDLGKLKDYTAIFIYIVVIFLRILVPPEVLIYIYWVVRVAVAGSCSGVGGGVTGAEH